MSYTPPVGDASTIKKGIVQLSGDLSGTASSPLVVDNAITETKLAVTNSPGTNQVLSWNGSAMSWVNQSGGGSATFSETFTFAGILQTGVGVMPIYNDSGAARTITSVRASVGTAPTGASVIVDVNVNATTVFPTQSQRPTIAAASQTSGAVSRSVAWPSGQALTIDVDQVGLTFAGANMAVTIEYS